MEDYVEKYFKDKGGSFYRGMKIENSSSHDRILFAMQYFVSVDDNYARANIQYFTPVAFQLMECEEITKEEFDEKFAELQKMVNGDLVT